MEFDYYQVDGSEASFIQIVNNQNNSVYSGGVRIEHLNGVNGNWYHLKFTIENGVLTILNETNGATKIVSLNSTPYKFNFWSSGNITAIRFKNFIIRKR